MTTYFYSRLWYRRTKQIGKLAKSPKAQLQTSLLFLFIIVQANASLRHQKTSLFS